MSAHATCPTFRGHLPISLAMRISLLLGLICLATLCNSQVASVSAQGDAVVRDNMPNDTNHIYRILSGLPKPEPELLQKSKVTPEQFDEVLRVLWRKRQAELRDAMSKMQDEAAILRDLIAEAADDSKPLNTRISALLDLEWHTQDIDKAQDFFALGGAEVCVLLLNDTAVDLSMRASWVLGSAVKHHTELANAAIALGAVPRLVAAMKRGIALVQQERDTASTPASSTAANNGLSATVDAAESAGKAVYALSSLLRSASAASSRAVLEQLLVPSAAAAAASSGGSGDGGNAAGISLTVSPPSVLQQPLLLDCSLRATAAQRAHCASFQRKVATLVADLATSAGARMEDGSSVLEWVGTQRWCELLLAAFQSSSTPRPAAADGSAPVPPPGGGLAHAEKYLKSLGAVLQASVNAATALDADARARTEGAAARCGALLLDSPVLRSLRQKLLLIRIAGAAPPSSTVAPSSGDGQAQGVVPPLAPAADDGTAPASAAAAPDDGDEVWDLGDDEGDDPFAYENELLGLLTELLQSAAATTATPTSARQA